MVEIAQKSKWVSRFGNARRALDPPFYGLLADPPTPPPPLHRRRHAHPREGSGGVLPEVRERAVKEGDPGHPPWLQ